MGLDNGINVYKYNDSIPVSHTSYPYNGRTYAHICYWRKWWGFRNEVIDYLCEKYNTTSDAYEWKLDIEDMAEIYYIYSNCTTKEWWDKYSDSIWSYEDIQEHIEEDKKKLRWLITALANDPNSEITFYDSF